MRLGECNAVHNEINPQAERDRKEEHQHDLQVLQDQLVELLKRPIAQLRQKTVSQILMRSNKSAGGRMMEGQYSLRREW